MKYHFTFKEKSIISEKTPIFMSNSPMNATRKIANKLFQKTDKKFMTYSLTVKNMDNNNLYYYKVICEKLDEPIIKKINEYKSIEIKNKILIQKFSKDLIMFLSK